MALFSKKNSRQSTSKSSQRRLSGDHSRIAEFLESSEIVEGALFFSFSALVVIVSFLGQQPQGPKVLLNQPAPTRLVAEFPFTFESNLLLEKEIEAAKNQIPPIFKHTFEPYEAFHQFIDRLEDRIAKNQIDFEKHDKDIVQIELEKTIASLTEALSFKLDPSVIIYLTRNLKRKERSELFSDSLQILRKLYDDGIYTSYENSSNGDGTTVIQITNDQENYHPSKARSLNQASIFLRRNLNALDRNDDITRALFEVFQANLKPNLLYSESETVQAIKQTVSKIKPQIQSYKKGDTLVEPGIMVTDLTLELVNAYNAVKLLKENDSAFLSLLFIKRTSLTVFLLFAVYFYIKKGLRDISKHNKALAITAVSIVFNLLIIRLIMEIGEIASSTHQSLLNILPFLAPCALAPIIMAVLVGTLPAILAALIIATIFGIVQDNSLEFMLIAFLSGVIGSLSANCIRKRSTLVQAGFFAGVAAAIAGTSIGLLNHFSTVLIGQQAMISLLVGLLTGIIAVGLLPILEYMFKSTTEITLLELTDFNHPLLRRMQMEAPGTYHHSLMVANLSEDAAYAIGANPLLCRVCCLFHDIGKLVKPDYFTENQQNRGNPHDKRSPSMSALVIKAHVKEGVDLARRHKLPRVITDVIRQHHGTSLIHYFYHQSQQHQKKHSEEASSEKNDELPPQKEIDESTYRYNGPKPAFKESAIIFFADGVEAASRNLKKATQPAVEELIDKIFKGRIEDGQLDDCPLTFQELNKIRKSFAYTLLNILHSRVEYPKDTSEEMPPK